MKRLALLSILALSLVGCEDSPVTAGRKAYKEYFNETLKDPSSLVIYKEEIIAQDNVSATFVLDVGAKNSYSGYVRKSFTIKTVGKQVLSANDYDERKYAKSTDKEKPKPVAFTYKKKNVPLIGFNPTDYIGKDVTLKDSCVYSLSDMDKFFNEDKGKAINGDMGYILPKGKKIKITEVKNNYFGVDGGYGVTYYIEQSAIF